jgi:F-box protein 18 (helicase)
MFKLTSEQEKILNAFKTDDNIKIYAFAGTGKTTTLLEVVKTFFNKRFLYLAFNKSIQYEAQKKFPRNTVVKTIHALAYQYIGRNYQLENLNAFKIRDILNVDYQSAFNILKDFEEYCNSDSYSVESAGLNYGDFVKVLYEKMKNKEIPATHSFYLKEFQLALMRKEINLHYDVVLLDEAQDTNPVTVSILNLINADKKIIVGDTHQQIYAFRGAVDALEKFEGNTYYLTNSFRFNEKIGNFASAFLNVWKNENKKIKGVSVYDDIKNEAIISRTNSKLIYSINKLTEEKEIFKTVREPYNIFGLSLNILKLKNNENLDRGFGFLKDFSYHQLLDMAEDETFEDIELKTALNIVEKFNSKLYDLYEIAKKYYEDKTLKPFYYLTTAHTSKGLEWDSVTLLDDFNGLYTKIANFFINRGIKKLKTDPLIIIKSLMKNKEISVDIINEINLFYVAYTRAKSKVVNLSDVTFNKNFINDKIYNLMK